MEEFGNTLGKLIKAAESLTDGKEKKKYVLAELGKKLEENPNKDILLGIADSTIDTVVDASLGKLGINKDNITSKIKEKLMKITDMNEVFSMVVSELDKAKKLKGEEKKKLAMTIISEWISSNKPELKEAIELIDLSIESTVKISHQVKKKCCK